MAEEMSLGEHFDELRVRVIHVVIAVIAITIFCMTFDLRPMDYAGLPLVYPYPDPVHNISTRVILYMQEALVPETVQLIQIAPGQAFFSQVYVAILLGIIGSMPVLVKEIAGFISPAMSSNARKAIVKMTAPSLALFVAGVLFAYLLVVPYVLNFLYQFGDALNVEELFNITDFISFVLQFLLAFGISFELPVLMYAISLTDAISPTFWRNNLRYAVLILIVFGAIITPDGSGITMWFVALPMIGLYLIGMFAVENRAKKLAEVGTNT